MDISLFIVVLGGRCSKSNIEIHDVRWVLGNSIEETFPELRKQWFGQTKGLHIDSYKRIKYIDGYKIYISESKNTSAEEIQSKDETLWFINLGGYNPTRMYEEHSFTLVAAKKAIDAKRKAKNNWKANIKNKHNDDFSLIKDIEVIDNVHSIKKINNLEIKLIPDEMNRSQELIPDWYGYMRIDKF